MFTTREKDPKPIGKRRSKIADEHCCLIAKVFIALFEGRIIPKGEHYIEKGPLE